MNFPINPTLNQEYSFNGITWLFNGIGWVQIDSSVPRSLVVQTTGQSESNVMSQKAVTDAISSFSPDTSKWDASGETQIIPKDGKHIPASIIDDLPSVGITVLAIYKNGINGNFYPRTFKWPTNKTISSVELISNCVALSCTIGETTYDQTTLVGVPLVAGTEMIINDLTINAGFDYAEALILF